MKIAIVFTLAATATLLAVQDRPATDAARWEQRASNVTIVRDTWGIAHVFGKSDADTVFGAIYAQAEDDFNRVETNFINSMGRLAEAEGDARIYQDLRMKLFITPEGLKSAYAASPAWLKSLMDAWADGLNYYLAKHPAVKPRVLARFEPWMALSFTEGSIGGDIEKVNLTQLQAFYGPTTEPAGRFPTTNAPSTEIDPRGRFDAEPSGSNGAAVAPANTTSHHALLLINPHTSFFFRSELQMVSDEGLNAYGASTWGQFFIYQGFNDRAGWMHTTSNADDLDEFLETVTKKGDHYVYKYGNDERPVTESKIVVPFRTETGMSERAFTVYRTQHGPIVRAQDGKWVAFSSMQDPVKALTQSYSRTKARSFATFRQTMELHTNASNNTIYADADGNIAYFHGNFIPRRDPSFDWTRPVDGSNPATDWKGVLSVEETPHLFNPASGWLYNSNDSPWSAAGPSSPRKEDFPKYVETGGESARGQHAVRVLQNRKDFTLEGLRAAAYDSYLTWFENRMPALIKAWDQTPAGSPLKDKTADAIAVLRSWDLRWAANSVATSVAVYWATQAQRLGGRGQGAESFAGAQPDALLQALVTAMDRLTADFGSWRTPWGEINRFQRLTDDIVHPFSDAGASIPVGFTSATWGSLASFGARAYPATEGRAATKKWYGTSGNSFVAVVEFGPKITARAVTAGGESGDPKSPHFNDQAVRYATGDLREVYFYKEQIQAHAEREYHPGR